MATHRIDISGLFKSDNDKVYWEPVSVKATTGPWEYDVLIFEDGSTRDGAHASFKVPKNYVGGAAIVVTSTAEITSGNVEADVDYRAVAVGESLNQAGTDQSVNELRSPPATAHFLQELVLTLTAGNFTVDDLVQLALFRDKTDAGDTLADEWIVHKIEFQFTDA